MPSMLIVDDDHHLRRLILTYALLEDFQCQEAEDAVQALRYLRKQAYDIIILDVMMPGPDGFEALSNIRKLTQTPIIMLTARSEEYDRLLGFHLGADDYVSKPFSPKELMARVNAILRRTGRRPSGQSLSFGGMTIDPDARMVFLDNAPVKLPPKEFELLLKMAQNEHILEDLAVIDLAYNEQMVSYLSTAAHGKMMLVDSSGRLTALYSYGYSIDLEEILSDIQIWQCIQESKEYRSILSGTPYTRERMDGARVESYETGIPVTYHGQRAYVILYRSFGELYEVLDMNRKQLVALSILLTLAASLLAAFLAGKFIKPILAVKKAVDRLAAGELDASPGFTGSDEIGRLADSVDKLAAGLRRVDVLRKEVIANVSHELRSPLSLIGGYAEMVRDITWKQERQRKENLNLIIREARRMSEMVSDIMDYSQFQSGYLQLNMTDCGLCEIIETETLHFHKILQENHLSLRLERPQEEYMIRADALKISQVIRNLLNNAINHTKDEGLIRVIIQKEAHGFTVSVVNPGEPIPMEDRELIWERYQRSQHQGARRQGTGIGLSIVSTILKAHAFSYGVDCENGLTRFWFQVPSHPLHS